MIYIKETSYSFDIPKHRKKSFAGPYTLHLVNNYTGSKYSYLLMNKVSLNDFFYTINYTINDLAIGEYTYKLTDKTNKTIESGLLTFGDYTPTANTVYNADKTNAIIYERN